MRLNITSKLKELSKNWIFWLIVITGIAIFLRSLPAWTNAAWGCDFGIYYGLTNSFVESGALFNPYYGWGSSYQYFPVLYAITGTAHWITGIDVITLMPKLVPIFGGLSVMIFYFVVRELIGNKKIALLSSLFLAVLPFHVYQTSHASPLTMGHFFMMLSIYLFIKYRQNTKYIIPLFVSTILLIMSHHLTTYIYLVSLIFIVFVENASKKEWTSSVKLDVLYILITSGLIFSYWAFIATPVYEIFMRSGLKIGALYIEPSYVLILFYVLFFSSFGIIWLKRKYNIFPKKESPTVRSCVVKFSVTLIICLTVMGIFSVVTMPWTNFSFTPLSVIYSIPLLLVVGFGVAGFRYTRFMPNGFFIRGWLLAILASFVYGLLTNSGTILPHRHPEYLMAPLSIIAVYGIGGIFLNVNYESLSKWWHRGVSHIYKPSFNFSKRFIQKRQIVYISVIIVLVATNAASVYPSHKALSESIEEISYEDLAVIKWMSENLNKNTSVITSDHRLAMLVEAEKFNTTSSEDVMVLWTAENLNDYTDELNGTNRAYDRITHILIDDYMRDVVVHVNFKNTVYMTNESSQAAYNKFLDQPFELLYRNETIDPTTGEALRWAEVYEVNWTHIKKFSNLP